MKCKREWHNEEKEYMADYMNQIECYGSLDRDMYS